MVLHSSSSAAQPLRRPSPPVLRATLMLPLASQSWECILPSLQTSPRLEPRYRGCRAPQAPPVLGQEGRADSDVDGQRPTASRGDTAIARHPGGQAGLRRQRPAGEHAEVTPEGWEGRGWTWGEGEGQGAPLLGIPTSSLPALCWARVTTLSHFCPGLPRPLVSCSNPALAGQRTMSFRT